MFFLSLNQRYGTVYNHSFAKMCLLIHGAEWGRTFRVFFCVSGLSVHMQRGTFCVSGSY